MTSTTVFFGRFEWDAEKAGKNEYNHGIDFYSATLAFLDPNRIVAIDESHSIAEPRYFCIGRIGRRVLTVRFTTRGKRVRIIGAGFWRKGKALYEEKNKKTAVR